MKVSVFDTYCKRKNGRIMHFDILVPDFLDDLEQIYQFGRQYLVTKGEGGQSLSASECKFCHLEEATKDIAKAIGNNGFYIIEMENCN